MLEPVYPGVTRQGRNFGAASQRNGKLPQDDVALPQIVVLRLACKIFILISLNMRCLLTILPQSMQGIESFLRMPARIVTQQSQLVLPCHTHHH